MRDNDGVSLTGEKVREQSAAAMAHAQRSILTRLPHAHDLADAITLRLS